MLDDLIAGASTGLVGTALGGLFRLAPEIVKLLDRKNERAHELAMFERQVALEQARGSIRLAEIGAERDRANDSGVLAAFGALVEQQTEMVRASADSWIAAVSASVRPFVTYFLLLMYGAQKAALVATATGSSWDRLLVAYSPADFGLLCAVVNYWFMDRTLKSRGLA